MSAPTSWEINDAIRSAAVGFPEPVAQLIAIELRVWQDFGARLAAGNAWLKMRELIAAIHLRELEVHQAADARALEASGA